MVEQKEPHPEWVARKLMLGALLTPEEWEVAKREGMFTCPPDTPYDALKRTHYEDDERRGYLCIENGKIASKVISRKKDGTTTYYLFGVHRESIKPEYLREDQRDLW